jgi:hypothetical protein
MSLLGAAMLWSGWTTDLEMLRTPCLVIKASPPGAGELIAVGPPRDTHHESRKVEVGGGTMSRTAHGVPMRERVSGMAMSALSGPTVTEVVGPTLVALKIE